MEAVRRKPGPPTHGSELPDSSSSMYAQQQFQASKSTGDTLDNAVMSREPQFAYGGLMFTSLLPPLAIMMAFGGRPALLVLCFGGLTAYIFDILGTIEGTLMAILVTLLGIWATLVWSARLILQESIFNFSIVIVMGAILIYLFIIICGHFRSLVNEFDSAFYFCESLLLSTIPLLASTILAWFLCVEMPALDLPTCFSTCYFVYTIWLAKPRMSSHPSASIPPSARAGGSIQASVHAITLPGLKLMYLMPVILSPTLYIALHHNVIVSSVMSAEAHLPGLAASFLCPVLYMIVCAEQQLDYWQRSAGGDDTGGSSVVGLRTSDIASFIGTLKLIVSAVLLMCLQEHPLLDDIKEFSGLPPPLDSAAVSGAALLIALAVYIHRSNGPSSRIHLVREEKSSGFANTLVSTCVAFAALLGGVLIDLPFSLLPLGVTSAFCLAEIYQRPGLYAWGSMTSWIIYLLLTTAAVVSIGLVSIYFTGRTVFLMNYDFEWLGSELTMQEFSLLFVNLVSASVVVPTLALGATSKPLAIFTSSSSSATAGKSASTVSSSSFSEDAIEAGGYINGDDSSSLLPGAVHSFNAYSSGGGSAAGGGAGSGSAKLKGFLFSAAFQVLVFAISAVELMVREQDWSYLKVSVSDVYPEFLIGATALAAVYTAIHLYLTDIIGLSTLWVVFVLQACKTLHLIGLPSAGIATAAFAFLAYTLPFVLHSSDSIFKSRHAANAEEEESATASLLEEPWYPNASFPQLLSYFTLALGGTYCARYNIVHVLMEVALLRDPTAVQQTAACVSAYCAFASLMGLVFVRHAATLRSLAMLVSAVAALVAADALGSLTVSLDPTSPTFLSVSLHPELVSEHTGLYFIISGLLAFAAVMKVLPVKHVLPRLFFLLAFSYTSAQALMGWSFPLSLSRHSPHHGTFQLPWLYCLVSTFAASSASIHSVTSASHTPRTGEASSSSSSSSAGSFMFVITACTPAAALAWALIEDTLQEHSVGILWVAAAVNAFLALSTRAAELSSEIKDLKLRSAGTLGRDGGGIGAASASVGVLSAFLGIFWAIGAALITPHVSSDLVVPAACLLLLCTRRNLIVEDTHPLAIAGAAASLWWASSALYNVFIKGYSHPSIPLFNTFDRGVGILGDENVSFWTASSAWIPWVNLALTFLPLPAIVLGFVRRKGESEEIVFVLAMLSLLSIVGAQCTSVRLLGMTGLIFGAWRCYDVGQKQTRSNRLI